MDFNDRLQKIRHEHSLLIGRKNEPLSSNGVWTRYVHPVVTAEHAPLYWRYDLNPQECVMVGNDAVEDTAALNAGISQVFLLTDCLLNKDGRDIAAYPHGDFDDLKKWLQQLNN